MYKTVQQIYVLAGANTQVYSVLSMDTYLGEVKHRCILYLYRILAHIRGSKNIYVYCTYTENAYMYNVLTTYLYNILHSYLHTLGGAKKQHRFGSDEWKWDSLRVAGHAPGMCVAVCCSVLQCIYIFTSIWIFIPRDQKLSALQGMRQVCMLQCVAVCCSVHIYMYVCCSVLQCVAVYVHVCINSHWSWSHSLRVAGHARYVRCSVLQCVAVYIHVYI